MIKNWGEVMYAGYVATVPDHALFAVPTWEELPDRVQLACQEKARDLIHPVFNKHFGDNPEAEVALFEMGQLDLHDTDN